MLGKRVPVTERVFLSDVLSEDKDCAIVVVLHLRQAVGEHSLSSIDKGSVRASVVASLNTSIQFYLSAIVVLTVNRKRLMRFRSVGKKGRRNLRLKDGLCFQSAVNGVDSVCPLRTVCKHVSNFL